MSTNKFSMPNNVFKFPINKMETGNFMVFPM